MWSQRLRCNVTGRTYERESSRMKHSPQTSKLSAPHFSMLALVTPHSMYPMAMGDLPSRRCGNASNCLVPIALELWKLLRVPCSGTHGKIDRVAYAFWQAVKQMSCACRSFGLSLGITGSGAASCLGSLTSISHVRHHRCPGISQDSKPASYCRRSTWGSLGEYATNQTIGEPWPTPDGRVASFTPHAKLHRVWDPFILNDPTSSAQAIVEMPPLNMACLPPILGTWWADATGCYKASCWRLAFIKKEAVAPVAIPRYPPTLIGFAISR